MRSSLDYIGKHVIQIKHLLIVRYIGGRSEVDEVTWRLLVGCERGDGGRVVVLGW